MSVHSTSKSSSPIKSVDGMRALQEFFSRMSLYCAAVDFDSTEILFADDVVSFGTKARVVQGLSQLRTEQWEHIWPNIEGFNMLLDEMQGSTDGDLAWGMLPWNSTGFDENGKPFSRPGRATAVLERRHDTWVCVHTHFSLAPGVAAKQSWLRNSRDAR